MDHSGDLKSDHSKIWKHLKSRLCEGHIANGLVFIEGTAIVIAVVPNIWKPDHSKSGMFPRYYMLFSRMAAISHISNGLASRFQILFEIQTICKPISFWPLKIWTCPDFRSPLCMVYENIMPSNFTCKTKSKKLSIRQER